MRIRLQRAAELSHEKEAAGHCGHPGAGDPRRRAVLQGDAEAHPLPHRAAVGVGAIRSADAPVALQEQPRANRVGKARDQRESAVEAVQRVLLDGQRVQRHAQAVGLLFPF